MFIKSFSLLPSTARRVANHAITRLNFEPVDFIDKNGVGYPTTLTLGWQPIQNWIRWILPAKCHGKAISAAWPNGLKVQPVVLSKGLSRKKDIWPLLRHLSSPWWQYAVRTRASKGYALCGAPQAFPRAR